MYDKKHDIRDTFLFRNHIIDHIMRNLGTCYAVTGKYDCCNCVMYEMYSPDLCNDRYTLLGELM